MTRTTAKSVTFTRPFLVSGFEGHQPAGTYTVETDEELIEGISFLAYHRTGMRIHLLPSLSRPGITEIVTLDPADLDTALMDNLDER